MDTTDNTVEPSTAEVLAEVKRRQAQSRPPMSERQRRVVIAADRFVFWLAKHWLASVIHAIYRPMCHQLPFRSWFLLGPQFAYTLPELAQRVGMDAVSDPSVRAFVGNEALGYKVALCQRDTAIYGAILIFGLVYGPLRRRWKVPPLPWWAYLGFGIVPMMLDGGYQFLSYALALLWPQSPVSPHETTPVLRVITGGLFGLSTIWLAYPYVQETMEELRETLHRRFGWR